MPTQQYPPLSFHFTVVVDGFPEENGFQQVDGLQVDIGEFSWAEGGENLFTHRLPDRVKYGDLKLKRGILHGSGLISWFKDAIENFDFSPKTVIVSLLDESHAPVMQWVFANAYPKGWQVDSFDAMNNKVSVENLTLTYQYFRQQYT